MKLHFIFLSIFLAACHGRDDDSDTNPITDDSTADDSPADDSEEDSGYPEDLVGEWCEVGTASCAILVDDGLPGIRYVAPNGGSWPPDFPRPFTATQVDAVGEFTSSNTAEVLLNGSLELEFRKE